MYKLNADLYFPPVEQASKEGIVAYGGDLSTDRLILAYKSGIFPWFNDGEPILWWSPNPRMVLFLDELKIAKSLKKIIKSEVFTVTFNQNFKEVVVNCQKIERQGQFDTWITDQMLDAYCNLNKIGVAKSVEVWQNEHLVGGLYGIDLGNVFCGESMFSKVSNASKIAFYHLTEHLKINNFSLLDCQVYNSHLQSLGCREISREHFLKILNHIK